VEVPLPKRTLPYLSFLVYLLDKDVAEWTKEKLGKVDTTFLPCTSELLTERKLS